ncbi:MAG TPA: hypothetical protein VKY31_10195, partial [Terriglobia bacterium]|nr:hypothetical protein [Terriglobia bacterium]
PSIPFFRYSDSSAWGESRSPSGKTSVTFEFCCDAKDSLLSASAADLAQMCFFSSREHLEVRRSSDLLDYVVRRVPEAFPVQVAGDSEQRELQRAFLATFQNLHFINTENTFGAGSVQNAIYAGLQMAKRVAHTLNAQPGGLSRAECFEYA